MAPPLNIPALVETIRDAVPDVVAVYLFGSMGREEGMRPARATWISRCSPSDPSNR